MLMSGYLLPYPVYCDFCSPWDLTFHAHHHLYGGLLTLFGPEIFIPGPLHHPVLDLKYARPLSITLQPIWHSLSTPHCSDIDIPHNVPPLWVPWFPKRAPAPLVGHSCASQLAVAWNI